MTMKRLDLDSECYTALMEALDAIKAVQATRLRRAGVVYGSLEIGKTFDHALATARATLDVACQAIETSAVKAPHGCADTRDACQKEGDHPNETPCSCVCHKGEA